MTGNSDSDWFEDDIATTVSIFDVIDDSNDVDVDGEGWVVFWTEVEDDPIESDTREVDFEVDVNIEEVDVDKEEVDVSKDEVGVVKKELDVGNEVVDQTNWLMWVLAKSSPSKYFQGLSNSTPIATSMFVEESTNFALTAAIFF